MNDKGHEKSNAENKRVQRRNGCFQLRGKEEGSSRMTLDRGGM
jgi:hypothetical protein